MTRINHQVSMRLEMAARSALNVQGRGALYGIVDADYIDQVGNAYTVLAVALAPYYKNAGSEKRAEIDTFLGRFSYLDETDLERDQYTDGVEQAAAELRDFIREL
ncbi:hypothetical protein ACQCU1_12565 [Sutcliffiella horikoshii]|uniref:hypothetical protein n=1 Tax=Sutcliffiella horikoshii TaxID=79883 RepID=UPI003CE71156